MRLTPADRLPQEVAWKYGRFAMVHWDGEEPFFAQARKIHAVVDGEDFGLIEAWVNVNDPDDWWQNAPNDPYCFGTSLVEGQCPTCFLLGSCDCEEHEP